jgi:DNA polymerase-3 subunit beta
MNFTITRQNLHTGLAAVSASIPSKTTLPVLSNILLEAREDGVWMSGTDLDVAVRVKALAEVKEAGSLTAPGKKLQEIARELPDEPVEVKTQGDQIELSCGRSNFKLNGLPAEEFPTLAEVDFETGLAVSGKDLQALIHHTSFAVSTEESRPILNGVLWELRDGEMKMVATNGHRLARMGVKVEATGTASADFIVPPAALSQVQRLFKDDEHETDRGHLSQLRAGHPPRQRHGRDDRQEAAGVGGSQDGRRGVRPDAPHPTQVRPEPGAPERPYA